MLPPHFFLSYRRQDSSPIACILSHQLLRLLPPSEHRDALVFFDRRSLRPGRDFPEDLEFAVRWSRVAVVLIGPDWARTLKDRDPAQDYVRREVEIALRHTPNVVPVCLNVTVDTIHELDEGDALRALAERNAIETSYRITDAGAELDATTARELIAVLGNQSGIDLDRALHSFSISPQDLGNRLETFRDLLQRSRQSKGPCRRRALLSEALQCACDLVEHCRLDWIVPALRDYRDQQDRILEGFLGNPRLLTEFFLGLDANWAQGEQSAISEFLTRLRESWEQFLNRPANIDRFWRAWIGVKQRVCRFAAGYETAKNPDQADQLLLCCVESACTLHLAGEARAVEPWLPAVVAQSLAHSLIESGERLAEQLGPMPELNAEVDMNCLPPANSLDALRQAAGASARAYHDRQLLARDVALGLLAQYHIDSEERLEAAATVLSDATADTNYQSTISCVEPSNRELLRRVMDVVVACPEDIAQIRAQNYCEQLRALALRECDGEPFEIDVPDNEVF